MTVTVDTAIDTNVINYPVDCAAGDLVTIYASKNLGGATTSPVKPADFASDVAQFRSGGTNVSVAIAHRFADGTEKTTDTITWTELSSGNRMIAVVVRSKEANKDWTLISASNGAETGTVHPMGPIGSSEGPVFYGAAIAAGANGASAYTAEAFTELYDNNGRGSAAYWDDPTPGSIGTTCTTTNSVDTAWGLVGFEAVSNIVSVATKIWDGTAWITPVRSTWDGTAWQAIAP